MNNKFGCLAFTLFLCSTLLPFSKVEIWRMTVVTKGYEVIPVAALFAVSLCLVLCVTGAPRLMLKGLTAIFLLFAGNEIYQSFVSAMEAYEAFGVPLRHADVTRIMGEVIGSLALGAYCLLCAKLMMLVFLFLPYTENRELWAPLLKVVSQP
ncbi:hypothetical protein [Vibrio sp. WXL103]|uniref:hypothetical protein n=1 Tax=unclassified Vibrio TaxID=2614977 RepID=UPI003EC5FD8A